MQPTLKEFFCLKADRDNFYVNENRDADKMWGYEDGKKHIDDLLISSQLSKVPPRLVWFGEFGCGKTHHLRYTKAKIESETLPFKVIMFETPDVKDKTPFNDLHFRMVNEIGSAYFIKLIKDYAENKPKWYQELKLPKDIEQAFRRMAENEELQKDAWIYVSGKSVDAGTAKSLGVTKKEINESEDFAAVLSVLSHVIKKQSDNNATLLYLIDEAEGLSDISNANAIKMWHAAIRKILDIEDLGIIFSVASQNVQGIPEIILHPSVVRRFGQENFVQLKTYEMDQAKEFLKGLLSEFIDSSFLAKREQELGFASQPNYDRLCYPFTCTALEGYSKYLIRDRRLAKPSEFLKKLDATTKAAVLAGKHIITREFLEEKGQFE